MNVLVTGGAGFIGSYLVDRLMARGDRVVVLDDLSSGRLENIRGWIGNPNFKFVYGSLLNHKDVKASLDGCGSVFHLAANSEVRFSSEKPESQYRRNIEATYNLLEAIRKAGNIGTLIFTSSSTVYGDALEIPTPENYAPLEPISVYGATKLACEALIMAYAHTYGFKAIIYRLANIIGPRSQRGVIYDFFQKLRRNPEELEILGDGTQRKSYLHVDDCVEAMLLGSEKTERNVEIFNVGSEDQVDVKTIAEIVVEEMNLKKVRFKFTGGVEGGRGWRGDVKNMLLDVSKLKALGWRPKWKSAEAVRIIVKSLVKSLQA